jgi:hypothetical protein
MAGKGGTETTSFQDYDQGANSAAPMSEFGTEFEPQRRACTDEESGQDSKATGHHEEEDDEEEDDEEE